VSFLVASAGPHVELVAAPLFQAGPLLITNSTLLGFIGVTALMVILFDARARIKSGRYNRPSIAVLWVFESLFKTTQDVLGSRERAKQLAPLAITMFFVIIINNWFGLLPFVGPVTYHGEPLLRGLAADLNFTLALAIITMVTAQVWAIRTHGFGGNLSRYFMNPFKDPVAAFTGILEVVAEFSRLVALAMRLFGNIFGGEVLLVVIAFITVWMAPLALPVFMLLELFVGAVQAYVFFMLTVVFVSLGTLEHEGSTTVNDKLASAELVPSG
jgi:F-type H+-transporting ATPase subunit a